MSGSSYSSQAGAPLVTLLEAHKLMYFMQVAGEPLKLEFTKGPYGPYAENLRHVLNSIEGHLLSGYSGGGDKPGKKLTLIPGAIVDARELLGGEQATQARFDRVADLVEGFESPFGLELLSTVHWICSIDGAHGINEVVGQTYAWNTRKKQFSERQIRLAYGILSKRGWINESHASIAE